eukprot:Rmarinus@m.9697
MPKRQQHILTNIEDRDSAKRRREDGDDSEEENEVGMGRASGKSDFLAEGGKFDSSDLYYMKQMRSAQRALDNEKQSMEEAAVEAYRQAVRSKSTASFTSLVPMVSFKKSEKNTRKPKLGKGVLVVPASKTESLATSRKTDAGNGSGSVVPAHKDVSSNRSGGSSTDKSAIVDDEGDSQEDAPLGGLVSYGSSSEDGDGDSS